MNINELNELSDKIIKNGIDIRNKDYLKKLYETNNFNLEIKKLDELIEECENYEKLVYTFAFYIGFFNLNSEINIEELPHINEVQSYGYLRGSLTKYFKDELKLKYNYFPVRPHFNMYSFVARWYPQPFAIHYSLEIILNWIYVHDEKFIYKLLFKEEHNYIFLATLKGRVIKDFKLNEYYVDFNCEKLKLYGLFHYLMYPYTDEYYNLDLNEKKEIWKNNSKIINLIDLDELMIMIVDLIKFKETKQIPYEILLKILNNLEKFYEEFEKTNIINIYELTQFCRFNRQLYSKIKLFRLIIKKLKNLLNRKHIGIDNYGWESFVSTLNFDELTSIRTLLDETKNNITFISELDKELRFEKFLIDTNKYKKIGELENICDKIIPLNEHILPNSNQF